MKSRQTRRWFLYAARGLALGLGLCGCSMTFYGLKEDKEPPVQKRPVAVACVAPVPPPTKQIVQSVAPPVAPPTEAAPPADAVTYSAPELPSEPDAVAQAQEAPAPVYGPPCPPELCAPAGAAPSEQPPADAPAIATRP